MKASEETSIKLQETQADSAREAQDTAAISPVYINRSEPVRGITQDAIDDTADIIKALPMSIHAQKEVGDAIIKMSASTRAELLEALESSQPKPAAPVVIAATEATEQTQRERDCRRHYEILGERYPF